MNIDHNKRKIENKDKLIGKDHCLIVAALRISLPASFIEQL